MLIGFVLCTRRYFRFLSENGKVLGFKKILFYQGRTSNKHANKKNIILKRMNRGTKQ